MLLQPRGQKRQAKEHYENSIRRGVALESLRPLLGKDYEVLRRLYPDGVARLWGSTPPKKENNAKARAIRERKPGDQVLFYADKCFFARATIAHLFDNESAAEAVWGIDDEDDGGATWKHMMALVDVEEFTVPIPSEQVGVQSPLRGLTLVSQFEQTLIVELLERQRRTLVSASEPSSTRNTAPGAGPRHPDVVSRFVGTETHRQDETKGQTAIALLWLISRYVGDDRKRFAWSEFQETTERLWDEFAPPARPGVTERVFVQLRENRLWDISGIRLENGFKPTPGCFDGDDPSAVLTPDVVSLLKKPLARADIIALLRRHRLTGLPDHNALLDRVGLGGYATASGQDGEIRRPGRRAVTADKIERNLKNVETLKSLHEQQCQVCGIQLETIGGLYSEAAHIRGLGRPHNGPDVLTNMLCLCPNHHAQFDRLGIYIDEDWTVRRTRDQSEVGVLRRHPHHEIDQEHIRHHRALCGRDVGADS
ncbi:putative restriction endonuclease [Streptoalloteichus tenebrarius]|uniref:Restriction endonuclease n=1 Tax=Streptoalloteichus tenebrarius (strain ATCC 17920 / DSM 40477 / JCM 4838 / CBS 697.72 / NBRC 16177 / NCIMB 11028 / NRRL B-12390 / A12253. 1 / ISP 5477) TaxID=1933 RepID=A0ABT1I0S3_STRSD|nr:HNH endonuclease [Streptoalloteichus tenebrarius]MCP2261331.1 putative restriction endonuclease [Streptoalloteichus tenebrarius]BFF03731.1 hypothetical protein GCM10020241_54060 [Streptoalloteichus tenebrarius]